MGAALDQQLMRQAIALARERLGQTGDNPAVGCVIARGETVLSAAATGLGGRPHAEEQALAMAGEAARDATAYVSLEPCAERSSGASSCSELLVRAGVARVVIAGDDPSSKASGQGEARLRAAGIEVETGLLAAEADPLYADYRRRL